ncbi:glucuronate isomerase [Alicyclobacillus mali]|uniref:Glucuronate isomerase n=1 Tax=Alicyclobacillus mali (ex Roth et al. 2021) TaxID=1123961 RepID=A0ABS0F4M2_9BACL|nr:glucuronate isomerase [Alicyclobacillus mali (ex Roth et al. 2021)]MBF8378181.1 glucuronate isomerase [Alicyclobacillus mali (ex Roth et al. 2021)]
MESSISTWVREAVDRVRVIDMHTHLFPPSFSSLWRSGADHVLTYHYLIAEAIRAGGRSPEWFYGLPLREQAAWVYEQIFARTSPLSEAAMGVVAIAQAFGVDLKQGGIEGLREALQHEPSEPYAERVFQLAGVDQVVMTNDPLDPAERAHWLKGDPVHPRFLAALRLDPFLGDWGALRTCLAAAGVSVSPAADAPDLAEVRRFLEDWIGRMRPVYLAFSAPPEFTYPSKEASGRVLDACILPACRSNGLPLALMIGVRRRVNPRLREAGDASGRANLAAVERLAASNPDVRFLVTVLSREDQHELVVLARKFANVIPFGCWWFVNTDTLTREISALRLELLGPTFVLQHSDARVLEHLVYKWKNARALAVDVLVHKYTKLAEEGWRVTRDEIERVVERLFRGNFLDVVRSV